jgi:YVTN family beta-propeller protein
MMVVDGATGKVVGDILNTPGVHGAGFSTKSRSRVYDQQRGDQTVTMFDLKTLAVIKQIKVGPGLDGIIARRSRRQDHPDESQPPDRHAHRDRSQLGDIVAQVDSRIRRPKAAADGKGRIFVNNEGKNTIQVIDAKTWKVTASWPLAPCDGPTGIAYDKASNRIFSGCSTTSVVVDAATGKVVASIPNGTRVDALGWDPAKKLDLHPERRRGHRHGGPPGLADSTSHVAMKVAALGSSSTSRIRIRDAILWPDRLVIGIDFDSDLPAGPGPDLAGASLPILTSGT